MVYSRRHPSASSPATPAAFPNAAAFIILLLLFPQIASFDAPSLWSAVVPDVSWRFPIQALDDDYVVVASPSEYALFDTAQSRGASALREQIAQSLAPPVVLLGLALLMWLAYLAGLLVALVRLRVGALLLGLALPHVVFGVSVAAAWAGGGASLNSLLQMLYLSLLYAVSPETAAPSIAAQLGGGQQLLAELPRWASLASLAWVVVALRFYSRAVAGFLLVVGALAISLRLGAAHSPLWPWALNLFTAVGLILALRLLWLIFTQNAALFWRLGFLGTAWGLVRSAVLWTPMLLLLGPFVIIDHSVRQQLKADLASSIDTVGQGTQRLADVDVPITIQTQTQTLVALQGVAQIREIRAQADQARRAMDEMLAADLRREVESIARSSIRPRIGFATPRNGGLLGPLKNAAESLAQDASNRAYATMRHEMVQVLGELAGEVQGEARAKRAAVQARLDALQAEAISKVVRANEQAQGALAYGFLYLDVGHRAAVVLFLLICIKSFANVFSRVALHHRKGGWVTLGGDSDPAHTSAAVREVGDVYELQAQRKPVCMYMSRRFAAIGCAPRLAIPQPTGAPLGRLASGTLALNRVEVTAEQPPVRYTATRGARFVEWTLGPGESVMLDLRYLVGVEATVQLSTLLSARFATLLLGGFAAPLATGPGRLVFLADGRVEQVGVAEEHPSLPPERIIAMQTSTRLAIDSYNNFADIYLSQAYVKPQGGGVLLVNVDQQDAPRTGLIRFALRFLWPF